MDSRKQCQAYLRPCAFAPLRYSLYYTRPMPQFIAVDFGGTNIRAARYTEDGALLARAQHPTLAAGGGEAVVERILATIHEVLPAAGEVMAVGVAAPGPLNPRTGTLIAPPNLPIRNFLLRDAIQDAVGVPVFTGNDANLAALAEWKFGAGRGHADVLYLTISTGIGSGVVSGGRLLLGKDGLAAEAGHILAVPDGPMCGCGQRGHLEAVASGTAIARTTIGRLHGGAASTIPDMLDGDLSRLTAATVGQAAQAGDALAIEVLAEASHWIGRTLASLMHLFNPGIVIFGGGVSQTGELLLAPIREAVNKYTLSPAYWEGVPIVQAQLGDDVGLLGALALALEETKECTT